MRLIGSFQTIVIQGESSRASWLVLGCSTSTGAVLTAVTSPELQCATPPASVFHARGALPTRPPATSTPAYMAETDRARLVKLIGTVSQPGFRGSLQRCW